MKQNILICTYNISDRDNRDELLKLLTETNNGQQLSESCYLFASVDEASGFYEGVKHLANGDKDMLWVGQFDTMYLRGHAGDKALNDRVNALLPRKLG